MTEEEEDVQEETLSIEGVEAAYIMKKLNLDKATYLDILKTYYMDLQAALGRIAAMNRKEEIKDFVVDVHGVKSISSSVGAMELSEMAKQLEYAGKESDFRFIDAHIGEFVETCERMVEALQGLFDGKVDASEKEDVPKEDAVLSALDAQWLQEMGTACDEMDSVRAKELLEQIREKRFGEKEKLLVKKIEEAVGQYEYDEVIALIQKNQA